MFKTLLLIVVISGPVETPSTSVSTQVFDDKDQCVLAQAMLHEKLKEVPARLVYLSCGVLDPAKMPPVPKEGTQLQSHKKKEPAKLEVTVPSKGIKS